MSQLATPIFFSIDKLAFNIYFSLLPLFLPTLAPFLLFFYLFCHRSSPFSIYFVTVPPLFLPIWAPFLIYFLHIWALFLLFFYLFGPRSSSFHFLHLPLPVPVCSPLVKWLSCLRFLPFILCPVNRWPIARFPVLLE